MQEQKQYSRAPITEAIIDLKVAWQEEFSAERFSDIFEHIEDRFPSKEPVYTGSVVFQAGAPIKVDSNQQLNGFLFKSDDNKKVFQATLNGFTLNRLAPYTSWEALRRDAKYLWDIYRDLFKPTQVTRAAVRFVNQLNIPTRELGDLKEYLNTIPEVAPQLPQKLLSSFFMQLQLPQEDLNCLLIINEALVQPTVPEIVTVILDFDLFRQHIWQSDDEEVWHFLDDLRHRKNEVFEACITDKTRRLIE